MASEEGRSGTVRTNCQMCSLAFFIHLCRRALYPRYNRPAALTTVMIECLEILKAVCTYGRTPTHNTSVVIWFAGDSTGLISRGLETAGREEPNNLTSATGNTKETIINFKRNTDHHLLDPNGEKVQSVLKEPPLRMPYF
ncbi:unnamed protein product [Menidia menidia]|uniref:(Atlantic silverside) hypothetical protein n=1 Tax=Menidia menidia TaxID=238744 RepID=A0A8S4B7H5_9TELE|nr:unnamed protein product [Menidia menidia]